jgi:carbonic anhydrase
MVQISVALIKEPRMNRLLGLFLIALLSASPLHAADTASAISATEALKLLMEGNKRFTSGLQEHLQTDIGRAKELAGAQRPYAIIVGCSDSRVPPELIFDEGIGRLFVIRVAGNVIGAEETASIEYALEHLGVKLVVVLGHTSCGAVGAAVSTKYGAEGPTPDLTALISNIHRNLGANLERFGEEKIKDPTLYSASKENALAVAKALHDRSHVVFAAEKAGILQVVPAVYHLDSGVVEFLPEKKPLRRH